MKDKGVNTSLKISSGSERQIQNYLNKREKIEEKRKEAVEKVLQIRKDKNWGPRKIAKKLDLEVHLVKRIIYNGCRNAKQLLKPSKNLLKNLYENGLSTRDIATLLEVSQRTIVRWMENYNIERKDIETWSEERKKYSREDFDGKETTKSYLLGFVIGDCGVRRHRQQIRIHTGSTHPAQIKLFKDVFSQWVSGFIECPSRVKKWYSWDIHCDLNKSFEFLLKAKKKTEVPSQVSENRKNFLSFLAGFIDAEGYIGCENNRGHVTFRISVTNGSEAIVKCIEKNLKELGYNPVKIHSSQKNCYELRLQRKQEVINLLESLPLKHEEKQKRRNFILNHKELNSWEAIKGEWIRLKNEMKSCKEKFRKFLKRGYEKKS